MTNLTLGPAIEEEKEETTSFGLTLGVPIQEDSGGSSLTLGPAYRENPFQNPSEDRSPLDPLLRYEPDQSLTKEEILGDKELFDMYVRQPMEARFGVGSRNRFLLDQEYDQDSSDEDLFEMWQNYQRSFAGGQTVTTASEVAFLQNADDKTKELVGRGYLLFDRTPNIFSEDTSWGEMFDGMTDYARAAVIDPTTLIGLGVGRVVAGAGTKAGATALRQAVVQAARQGLSKRAIAKAALSTPIAKEVAATAAVDLTASIASDLGYQYSRIETGTQESYSPAQTAISSVGAVVLPSVVVGFHGIKGASEMLAKNPSLKGSVLDSYINVKSQLAPQMTPEAILDVVVRNVDGEAVAARLGTKVQQLIENPPTSDRWLEDVAAGREVVKRVGGVIDIEDGSVPQKLLDSLIFGDEAGPGLLDALNESGIVFIDRFPGDKYSNFMGDIISSLPDEYISKVLEPFEGTPFGKLTGEDLGLYFKRRSSQLGRELGKLGIGARTITADTTVADVARSLGNKFDAEDDEVAESLAGMFADKMGKETAKAARKAAKDSKTKPPTKNILWIQSMWKRLVTAHPGTAALNIKGYVLTSALNGVSDIVEGALTMGGGVATMSPRRIQRGFQVSAGGTRRLLNHINYMDSLDSVENFLNIRPDVEEKLFRFINGGVDDNTINDIAKLYGLDPNSKFVQAGEKGALFLQQWSGTLLQDHITKRLSFMSNLELEIRRNYGMSYNEFFEQPDAYVKMFEPKFRDDVLTPSLERARRETYSKPYAAGAAGKGFVRGVAKFIEQVSNTEGLGMLIPFGQFMNNSIATISDYSGINLVRHTMKRMQHKAGSTIVFDPAEESAVNLLAKTAVGYGLVFGYFVPREIEKMERGVRWNEEEPIFLSPDGSMRDTTFEAPYPYFSMLGRVWAHRLVDGEVPAQLRQEGFDLFIGQSTRELGQAGEGASQFFQDFLQFAWEDTSGAMLDAGGAAASQIISGFTRPLDPINQFAALVTDSYENMDRRQGVQALNEAVRYVDQILPLTTSTEVRNYPTAPRAPQPITNVMGHRIVPKKSTFDRMLAATGRSPWQAVKWEGDYPRLKNRLDGMIEPIINYYADQVLAEHDFFNLPLKDQEYLVQQIATNAKEEAKEMLLAQDSNEDQILYKLRTIYGAGSQLEIKRAMDMLGMDDMKLEDAANRPDGTIQLDRIIDILQNPDDYRGFTLD